MTALPPNATIGIVGGGQLGRMSALAAARLGYRCHILTDDPNSPAAQVAAGTTIGAYDDPEALRAFAAHVDVVTFEFENVSAAGLDLLASLKPVHPSPTVLRISQDRVAEKTFLNTAGIATAPWRPVENPQDLQSAAAAIGLIDFACEISVLVARGTNGDIATFDAVENRHRHHILDLTLAPARIPEATAAQAKKIARTIAQSIDLIGLLAVEMFIDARGAVLVNELAPRPHNSGHWTIDACPASQFEMHIRAVAGLPLPPATRHSDAVMKNLVGPEETALWPTILATPGLIPHLYGKTEARPGRKMGHVTRLFPRGSLPGEFGIADALGGLV